MAISYVDTVEVGNISKEILSLADDLSEEFNDLFKRLSEVPTITREWFGPQANYYFRTVASEKNQYIKFANELKSIGYKLARDVYEIQTCVNKNNEKEAGKGDYNVKSYLS